MNNAFMIASTGSGCGKTTITCALLKAIKNKKLIPKAYKCGPDYIDPMFHKSILNIESLNLDLFFSEPEEIENLFYNNDAEVSVVEGVMGLYDGISLESNRGSSYDLAIKLNIPIILIINANGMGRSVLATIKGFLSMDEHNLIKAVVLNRVSSMYYPAISSLIENEINIPVIGYFPKMENINIESRYLGLKMPEEIANLSKDIEASADIIRDTLDFDKLFALTAIDKKCHNLKKSNTINEDKLASGIKIGLAKDRAFCFYYEQNIRMLRSLGVELIEFSPLDDSSVPEGISGLIFGGGYPELFANQLSENKAMLESLREVLKRRMPSLAECGGFMYLHSSIVVENKEYPMVGMIDGKCEKKDRLVRFGYLEIQEVNNNFIKYGKKKIKGHEFHYFDSSNNGNSALSTKPNSARSWEAAHIDDNHWWGFAHLYYPSNIDFVKAFIDKCYSWHEDNPI